MTTGANPVSLQRPHGFYITDNELVDKLAKDIGIFAFGVYHMLLRVAANKPGAKVSLRAISTHLAISRDSATNAIATLKNFGLVVEQPSKNPNEASMYLIVFAKDVVPENTQNAQDSQPCPEIRTRVKTKRVLKSGHDVAEIQDTRGRNSGRPCPEFRTPNKEEDFKTETTTRQEPPYPPSQGGEEDRLEEINAKATARPGTREHSAAEHVLRQPQPVASGESTGHGKVDGDGRDSGGEGSSAPLPVKPLVGKRTAQEILDHYRKPAREKRGGDFESVASIAKVIKKRPTVTDWRAGFNGVLEDIHRALFQTSLNVGPKGHPNLTDGADEWRDCFESVAVADYEADEVSGQPLLIVTSKNPAKTAAAFKKYSKRIEAGMDKYFGQVVQISVRSEA